MGYTRYWNRTSQPITEDFCEAVRKIIEDSKAKGIFIGNGWGEGEPIITLDTVSFNGDASKDLDHETCYFSNEDEVGFNFCKTARKPYDYTVREVLKVAEQMGIITDVRSDGENEEIISDEEYLTKYGY